MRLGLVVVLCLLSAGCAIVRKDAEEPVDNEPRTAKAEPVLKPSEVLAPKSLEIASPLTDRFYMRGTYFPAAVTTELRLDPNQATLGTLLSAEDDLGLDDQVDQGRMEFDIRLAERSHVRIDYFKLNRFNEQPLPRDIVFGDFIFDGGHELSRQARLARADVHLHLFVLQVRPLRRRPGARHPRRSKRTPRVVSRAR